MGNVSQAHAKIISSTKNDSAKPLLSTSTPETYRGALNENGLRRLICLITWVPNLQNCLGRCGLVGVYASLRVGFRMSKDSLPLPVCFLCLLLADQDVSFQLFLLPCLCSSIRDSNSRKPQAQLNTLFYNFPWSWYSSKTIEKSLTHIPTNILYWCVLHSMLKHKASKEKVNFAQPSN